MLSMGLCKLKKHRAKVVRKLSGAIQHLKKHRAIVVRRLRKSTKDIISVRATNVVADSYKFDKHHIVQVLSRCCPGVVRKLSGSCPDLVRGEDRINTKLQGSQNWTYIQRLTISRPVMGTVFCALSIEGGPRAYFATKITYFYRKTKKSIRKISMSKKVDFSAREARR